MEASFIMPPTRPVRKHILKHGQSSCKTHVATKVTSSYTHVSELERKLILNMFKAGITWAVVRQITGLGNGAIQTCIDKGHPRSCKKRAAQSKKGHPVKITPSMGKRLLKTLDGMLKAAKGRREVTAAQLKVRAKIDACDQTVRKYLKQQGIVFKKLKEKLLLSKADKIMRKAWARKRSTRSKAAWLRTPHAIIDNKSFRLYRNGKGRDHAARRACRGAYQRKGKRGQAVKDHFVKPRATLPYPSKGVIVTAAVIKGKIRMWDYVTDKRWCGAAAAKMYSGPLAKALKRAYPLAKRWTIIEDGDPSGYRSSAGKAAKKKARISTDDLPPRSPDFNVLDYSLWHAINERMREQERAFSVKKKETKEEYLARLRRTALGLPASVVKRAVMDMHRRVRLAVAAKGAVFIE